MIASLTEDPMSDETTILSFVLLRRQDLLEERQTNEVILWIRNDSVNYVINKAVSRLAIHSYR